MALGNTFKLGDLKVFTCKWAREWGGGQVISRPASPLFDFKTLEPRIDIRQQLVQIHLSAKLSAVTLCHPNLIMGPWLRELVVIMMERGETRSVLPSGKPHELARV